MTKICVVATNESACAELVSGGKALNAYVVAVVFDEASAAVSAAHGADKTLLATTDSMVEGFAASISQFATADGIEFICVDASVTGRLLAGKIASILETSVVANVAEVLEDANQFTHMVYGGAAIMTENAGSGITVATVNPGSFAVVKAEGGPVENVDWISNSRGIQVIEVKAKEVESVNLSAAKSVVGVGRGFNSEEELQIAYTLASALGAEIACSRPITEGEHWMSRERYIGVSGVVIKPEAYFAVGISGQVQHMVGVNQAGKIFAINKDKNAPIFKYADVGIVADLKTVVPAIAEKLG